MPSLPIKKEQSSDNGRLLVRLNFKHRDKEISRYDIAKLTNNDNKKSEMVLILGHHDDTAIFMPYDIRVALGAEKGEELNFTIHKVGLWGKLCWYLRTPDPAIYIPGWIAVVSVVLAIVGILIAL